ncbi:hypothetical protein Pmar_PMAR010556, partial [Perkinsus marinus ATCC 50983]
MKCAELCEALADTKAFLTAQPAHPVQAKKRQMMQLKDFINEEMPLPPGSSANIDLSREVMAVEPALREVGDDSKRSRTFNICLHEWLKLSSLHKAPPNLDLTMDQLKWWMQHVVQEFHHLLDAVARRAYLQSVEEANAVLMNVDSIVTKGTDSVVALVQLLDSAVHESA